MSTVRKAGNRGKTTDYIKSLIAALGGGALGSITQLPGGTILGAMIGVGAVKLAGQSERRFPGSFSLALQVLTGILLGVKFNLEELALVQDIIMPALVITVLLVAAGLTSAWIITRWFHWGPLTAWLASAPGRMADMAILAHSLELDGTKIVAAHTARVIVVVMATPIIVLLVS